MRFSALLLKAGFSHSRPQSPSFLGRLQIKPSGSGDENGLFCDCVRECVRVFVSVCLFVCLSLTEF